MTQPRIRIAGEELPPNDHAYPYRGQAEHPAEKNIQSCFEQAALFELSNSNVEKVV